MKYEDRLLLPLQGLPHVRFFTREGTHVATGYVRVVIGGRGPYIEFSRDQVVTANFHIPAAQRYRLRDDRVYYVEARSNDIANVKLYYQKKTVDYADYRIGLVYMSPFDLTSDKYPELVKPLS